MPRHMIHCLAQTIIKELQDCHIKEQIVHTCKAIKKHKLLQELTLQKVNLQMQQHTHHHNQQ